MSILISINDFIGKYNVTTPASDTSIFQSVCDEVEAKWMLNLLGETESAAFIADASATGIPTLPQYLKIYNVLQLSGHCSTWEVYSSGVKDMLINAVYAQWYNDVAIQGTLVGLKKIDTTNSSSVPATTFKLKNNWNLAVNNYRVIQKYIYSNSSDFPDFAGINKNYTTPF